MALSQILRGSLDEFSRHEGLQQRSDLTLIVPVEETEIRGDEAEATPFPSLTLERLVAQITPGNLHGEQEIGQSVGREAW